MNLAPIIVLGGLGLALLQSTKAQGLKAVMLPRFNGGQAKAAKSGLMPALVETEQPAETGQPAEAGPGEWSTSEVPTDSLPALGAYDSNILPEGWRPEGPPRITSPGSPAWEAMRKQNLWAAARSAGLAQSQDPGAWRIADAARMRIQRIFGLPYWLETSTDEYISGAAEGSTIGAMVGEVLAKYPEPEWVTNEQEN